MNNALRILEPSSLSDKEIIEQWSGKVHEWFVIEVVIFFYYGLTLIILLIKGKFIAIGIDSSY